jgi:hypothetical protein
MRRAGVLAVATVMAATAGCDRPAPGVLVVATSWPLAQRVRLQSDFRQWVTSSALDPGHTSIELKWLILAPGDDIRSITRRRHPPDVLLGSPSRALERLAHDGGLLTIQDSDDALWCASRQRPLGMTEFRDPRTDAIALERVLEQLEPARWRQGYARLVEFAGNEPRIGCRGGERPPARGANEPLLGPGSAWREGLGILQSTHEPAMARAFLRFMVETRQAEPVHGRTVNDDAIEPDVESLVADLLGATLVDAQDELWTAWSAMERAGSPEPARMWLTEPPPWPPASIEKYLKREGENAMALVETLAAELSPLPAARGWLIRSWLSPPRIVDAALLTEMARAADGALCREPRFRAWLRAEWTASARQRYRRVTRLAAKTQPSSVAK